MTIFPLKAVFRGSGCDGLLRIGRGSIIARPLSDEILIFILKQENEYRTVIA